MGFGAQLKAAFGNAKDSVVAGVTHRVIQGTWSEEEYARVRSQEIARLHERMEDPTAFANAIYPLIDFVTKEVIRPNLHEWIDEEDLSVEMQEILFGESNLAKLEKIVEINVCRICSRLLEGEPKIPRGQELLALVNIFLKKHQVEIKKVKNCEVEAYSLLVDGLLQNIFGEPSNIWIPAKLESLINVGARFFDKAKMAKKEVIWSLLKKNLPAKLEDQFTSVFSDQQQKKREEALETLRNLGGKGGEHETLYEKICFSLSGFIQEKAIEKIPEEAFRWSDFLWRKIGKPQEFDRDWFAEQITTLHDAKEKTNISIHHLFDYFVREMGQVFVLAIANNLRDRTEKKGVVQDFVLDSIGIIDQLANSLSESQKKQLHEMALQRRAIRHKEILRREWIDKLEEVKTNPAERKKHDDIVDELDFDIKNMKKILQSLRTKELDDFFSKWQKDFFKFLKIDPADFPLPPLIQETIWKSVEELVVEKTMEIYGDLHEPFYFHEQDCSIEQLEEKFVQLFSNEYTGNISLANLKNAGAKIKKIVHSLLCATTGKEREESQARCCAIAHVINRLMPEGKYEDRILGDWIYRLLTTEEKSTKEKVGRVLEYFDRYIDASVLKMGYHFANTTFHRESAFASTEDVYQLLIRRAGVKAGDFLREAGLLEKKEEFRELQDLLKEWTLRDQQGLSLDPEKEQRLVELKKTFCEEMFQKTLHDGMKGIGLQDADIPFPISYGLDNVLSDIIFADVFPSWVIENYGEALLLFSESSGMIHQFSQLIRDSKERISESLKITEASEAKTPAVVGEGAQFALNVLDVIFAGQLGETGKKTLSDIQVMTETFAQNLQDGLDQLRNFSSYASRDIDPAITQHIFQVCNQFVQKVQEVPPAFLFLQKKIVRIVRIHEKQIAQSLKEINKKKARREYLHEKKGLAAIIAVMNDQIVETLESEKKSIPDLEALHGALEGFYEIFIQSVIKEKGVEEFAEEVKNGKNPEEIIKDSLQVWQSCVYSEIPLKTTTALPLLAAPFILEPSKKNPSHGFRIPFFSSEDKEKTLAEQKALGAKSLIKWRKDFFQHLLRLPDQYETYVLFKEKKQAWQNLFLDQYGRLDEALQAVSNDEGYTLWKRRFLADAKTCMQTIAADFGKEKEIVRGRIEQQGLQEGKNKPSDLGSEKVFAAALLGQKHFAKMVQEEALDPEGGSRILYGVQFEAIADYALANVYTKIAEKEDASQEQVVVDLIKDSLRIFTEHAQAERKGERREMAPIDEEKKRELVKKGLRLAGIEKAADLTKFGVADKDLQEKFWDLTTTKLGGPAVESLMELIVEPETMDQLVLAVLEKLGTENYKLKKESFPPYDQGLDDACGSLLLEVLEHVRVSGGAKFFLKRKSIQRWTKRQIGRAIRESITERFLVKNIDEIMGNASGKMSLTQMTPEERRTKRVDLEKKISEATKKMTYHFRTRHLKRFLHKSDEIFQLAFGKSMGKPGLAIYRLFKLLFSWIFIRILGTLFAFLAMPVTYALDRYMQKRVNEARAMLKRVVTEQLVVALIDSAVDKFD